MSHSPAAARSGPESRWWTPRRRSFAWLGLVLVACVGTFVAVYRVTVHTVTWRLIDDVVVRGADLGPQADEPVSGVLDVVTVSTMAAAVAIVAIIALLQGRRIMGVAAVLLVVIANLASRLLKSYVLTRPDLGLAEYTPATLNSLPSGHATAAFSVVAALMFVVPARLRPLTALVGVAGTSTIAFATMFARWHRASDAVASFVLVTAVAAGLAMIVLAVQRPAASPAGPPMRPSAGHKPVVTWPRLLSVGLLGLSALLILPLSTEAFRESSLGAPVAFLSAGCSVVGTALACTIVVMRIVERLSTPRGPAKARSSPAASPSGPAASPAPGAPTRDQVRDTVGTPPPTGQHDSAARPPAGDGSR